MKQKIIDILKEYLPYDPNFHSCFVNAENLRRVAHELLVLFNKSQYREEVDWAGIDPVKWGGVPDWNTDRYEEDTTKTWLECIRGTWRGLVPDSWVPRFLVSNRWFEDDEGIVDTEIIK